MSYLNTLLVIKNKAMPEMIKRGLICYNPRTAIINEDITEDDIVCIANKMYSKGIIPKLLVQSALQDFVRQDVIHDVLFNFRMIPILREGKLLSSLPFFPSEGNYTIVKKYRGELNHLTIDENTVMPEEIDTTIKIHHTEGDRFNITPTIKKWISSVTEELYDLLDVDEDLYLYADENCDEGDGYTHFKIVVFKNKVKNMAQHMSSIDVFNWRISDFDRHTTSGRGVMIMREKKDKYHLLNLGHRNKDLSNGEIKAHIDEFHKYIENTSYMMLFPNKDNTPTYGLNSYIDLEEVCDNSHGDLMYVSSSDTYLHYCEVFKDNSYVEKNGYSSIIKYKDIDFDRFKSIKERVINEVKRNITRIKQLSEENPDMDKWDIYKIIDDESMATGIPDIFNIRYQVTRQLPWYEADGDGHGVKYMAEDMYNSLGCGKCIVMDLDDTGKIVYSFYDLSVRFDNECQSLDGSFEENIKALNLNDEDVLCMVELHY